MLDLILAFDPPLLEQGFLQQHRIPGWDVGLFACLAEPKACSRFFCVLHLRRGGGVRLLGVPFKPARLDLARQRQLRHQPVHPRPKRLDGIEDKGGVAMLVAVEDAAREGVSVLV